MLADWPKLGHFKEYIHSGGRKGGKTEATADFKRETQGLFKVPEYVVVLAPSHTQASYFIHRTLGRSVNERSITIITSPEHLNTRLRGQQLPPSTKIRWVDGGPADLDPRNFHAVFEACLTPC